MKSKKKSDEKAQVIEIEIEGNLEDLLTEEELKQLEEDEYLDGGPGYVGQVAISQKNNCFLYWNKLQNLFIYAFFILWNMLK